VHDNPDPQLLPRHVECINTVIKSLLMRKQFSLLLFWSVLSTFAFAQHDFRPGYVITLDSDTISGEVEYRLSSRNYQSCNFRQNGNLLEYNATQIKGYGFLNDRAYKSGVVDRAFVEVLVSGGLSLYRHGDIFFMEKDNSELHKFETTTKEKTVNGKVSVGEDVRWKGVVSYLTNDCLQDQNQIARLRINELMLTRLVVDYNECRKTPFHAYKADKPWIKFDFGVFLGVHMSGLNVRAPSFYTYLKKRYDSTDPFAAAVVAISSPRAFDRFALQTGIEFSKSEYSGLIHWKVVPRRNDKTFVSLNAVSIPLALRYEIPLNHYSVQVYGGIKADFYLNSEARLIRETIWESWVDTEESDAFVVKKLGVGYMGGLSFLRSFGKVNAGVGARYSSAGLCRNEFPQVKNDVFSVFLVLQRR